MARITLLPSSGHVLSDILMKPIYTCCAEITWGGVGGPHYIDLGPGTVRDMSGKSLALGDLREISEDTEARPPHIHTHTQYVYTLHIDLLRIRQNGSHHHPERTWE